jgi:hypothetical protein
VAAIVVAACEVASQDLSTPHLLLAIRTGSRKLISQLSTQLAGLTASRLRSHDLASVADAPHPCHIRARTCTWHSSRHSPAKCLSSMSNLDYQRPRAPGHVYGRLPSVPARAMEKIMKQVGMIVLLALATTAGTAACAARGTPAATVTVKVTVTAESSPAATPKWRAACQITSADEAVITLTNDGPQMQDAGRIVIEWTDSAGNEISSGFFGEGGVFAQVIVSGATVNLTDTAQYAPASATGCRVLEVSP